MRKKLLFMATVLILFATSCHKEFSIERARELASLHANASDYTESEVKEIQDQMDAYVVLCQGKIDEVLSEHDPIERKRKGAVLAAWCANTVDYIDVMSDLTNIVKKSPYGDQKRHQEFGDNITEILMKLSLTRKEVDI